MENKILLTRLSVSVVTSTVTGIILDKGIDILPINGTTKTVVKMVGRIAAMKLGVDLATVAERQIEAQISKKENGSYVDLKGKLWIRAQ